MLVSIGTYAICDGTLSGGVAIGQARVQIDRGFDVVVPLAELNAIPLDRVYRKLTFTFQVQRTHTNAGAAELFILDLDSSLPSSGTVTITPTGNGSVRYVPNGAVTTHNSQQNGSTTTTQYTLIGGQPTATAP